MLLGSTPWATAKVEASPEAGAPQPQVIAANSGCHPAHTPRAVLFSAVMQASRPACKPADSPQLNNARAPQDLQRPLSGTPLFRRDDAVRYTF
jgi:hypothetical protein